MTNRPSMDFSVAPFIVIWEVTRACDLACCSIAEPMRSTTVRPRS